MTILDAQSPVTAPDVLPTLEQARAYRWDAEQIKRRGIYGFDSRDIRSRPFNMIRSRLLKLHKSRGWRLFGVVSAAPSVGKSFIATNLAAALSRTPGLQTYLIDLDLRRGSISRNFGFPADVSVRQYLEEDVASLGDVAFRLENERLIVVPSDRSRAHSAEVLAGRRMEQLAKAMRDAPSDHIFICDLPPVFANDDASIVISKLDGYVMVVEDGQTTKKQITEATSILDRDRCAGVVLNHFHGGLLPDTYGYNYGSSKAYGDYFK